MRKLVFIAVLCAFVAAPALADFYGGRVWYNRIGGYYSGGGGEFTLSSDGGLGLLLDLSAYKAGVTKNVLNSTAFPSFQTFCVENNEYVGQPMDIEVSTTWTGGGTNPQWDPAAHSPASHAVMGGMPSGDDLNPQTAYVYTQFAKGLLSSYNWGAGRNTSARDLQKAIWYMEGEIGMAGLTAQAGIWVQEAVTASGLSFGSYNPVTTDLLYNTWGATIGNVRVLNTWVPGYVGNLAYKRQDQLYLTPIPGAAILGILGLGVVSLKLRKFA